MYGMFAVGENNSRVKPIFVTVQLNDATLEMEVDTGATSSIISSTTYHHLWKGGNAPKLHPSKKKLYTYTGELLKTEGFIKFTVKYASQVAELELIVVAGEGPSLFGRDWLEVIKLDWTKIHQISGTPPTTLQPLLEKHKAVFQDELGLIKGVSAKIYVNSTARPQFYKPRSLPQVLRTKVEQELQRLEKMGVITQVQFANWAAPIVPVIKKDGSVRICGDYKVTINQATNVDSYPLPKIDDLLASLGLGKIFSKLDHAHAYQQVLLDEESRRYVVVNTHKGLYQYNRLPFGVSSAPSIFQRTIEEVLQGIPHVCVYLDDILIAGQLIKTRTPQDLGYSATEDERCWTEVETSQVFIYDGLCGVSGAPHLSRRNPSYKGKGTCDSKCPRTTQCLRAQILLGVG